MQSWKSRRKEKDAIKGDALGEVNRVTFEYSQWLKDLNTMPTVDFGLSEYADAASQLLVRARHERDTS